MVPLPFPGISLFFDVDGTLIDIAERPEAVVVPARLLASLSRAQSLLGGALALVSGRTVGNLDDLFRPLQLAASGVHGAEFRLHAGAAIIEAASQGASPDQYSMVSYYRPELGLPEMGLVGTQLLT